MNREARPDHSETYWAAMKYVIIGLTGLMILALILAVIVVLRLIPWS
jgi:uncharacterized membrane protein YuzA (DUF378 family)